MRISDWSSDVCSSDLYISGNRENSPPPRAATLPHVPRIQRATPINRNNPPDIERIRAERASRYQPTNRSMPRETIRPTAPARDTAMEPHSRTRPNAPARDGLGRVSLRESVCPYVWILDGDG